MGEMVVEALRVIPDKVVLAEAEARDHQAIEEGVEDIQEVRVKATILGEGEVLTQIQLLPSFPAQTSGPGR